ncbi:MAG: hypothetical protein ACRD0P_10865 [Stackebrandtia sp.]
MAIRIKALGNVAVATGVIAVISSMVLVPMSAAAEPRSASSALTELEITEIPAVGVAGFSGVYGTAGTPDLAQSSDTVDGDFSDPDGVLDYVTINGNQVSSTSWDSAAGQLTARTNATAFEVDYNGVDDFLTSGSIDSYARCLDNGDALAYARGDGSTAFVLGQAVGDGENTIETTGAALNMPSVDTATLTVTVERVENVVNEPTEVSAEAYFQVTVEGELRDANGDVIYDGPMMRFREGHVKVTCKPQIDPSPTTSSLTPTSSSPSSTSGSPSPTTTSPTTTSPSPTSPTTTSPSPTSPTTTSPSPTSPTTTSPSPTSPSPSSTTDGPTSSAPPTDGPGTSATSSRSGSGKSSEPVPPGSNTPGDGGLGVNGGPELPRTGPTGLYVLVTGLAAVALGLFLLLVARRRAG